MEWTPLRSTHILTNASLNIAVNSAIQAQGDHVLAGLRACSARGCDFGEKASPRRRVGVLPVTTRVPARVMITTEPRCEFQRRLSRKKWDFWALYLPRDAPPSPRQCLAGGATDGYAVAPRYGGRRLPTRSQRTAPGRSLMVPRRVAPRSGRAVGAAGPWGFLNGEPGWSAALARRL